MENYEEKYKQALERARVWRDKSGMPINKKGILDDIFPELAESDDEKIRKWIINEIKIKHHNLDEANVDFVDKAIAWLEKQGEQKPTDEEIKILLQTEYEKGRADAIEQKSAWSEEDEKGLGDALWCCKQAASLAKDENDMGNAWYAETWLKSIKDKVQQQDTREKLVAIIDDFDKLQQKFK